MFKKFKDLFLKEEQQPRQMSISDIPGWLDSEMKKIREHEEIKVSGSRGPVMQAISTLKEMVPELGTGDHEGTGFAKLEKVAENSLPLYKKSMMSALSRPFPEKTQEFYHAVAECLKGCIKSSQGPGRYLVRVFPEEMKLIQAEVSRLGKEVNAMNPVFAESRLKHASLEKIGTIHHSLIRMVREHDDLEKKMPDLLDESAQLGKEEEELSIKVKAAGDDPRFLRYTDLMWNEQEVLRDRERLGAEMAVLSGMVVHVMRRAEKVAHKDRNDLLGKKIHVLAETLSKNEMPAANDLLPMISGVLPPVIDMVASGEITLKNRDEQEFFTNSPVLPSRLEELYRKSDEIDRRIRDIREQIGNDTFILEKEALEKRYKQKKSEYHENERNIIDSRQKIDTTAQEIPELIQQIEEHISQYSGQNISISVPVTGQADESS
ncbi:MAG TPA: hypothetical protein VMS89_03325 [Methanoregulaceae archaeon]|nr:hypothetical protein [Methanoregulaceae archaeon]